MSAAGRWRPQPGRILEVARRFLHWWGGELFGLLPDRLSRLAIRSRCWVVVDIARDGVAAVGMLDDRGYREVARMDAGTAGPLRSEALDNLRRPGRWVETVIRLPAEAALIRHLVLPAAAAANLRPILTFELERLIPYRPELVLFDYAYAPRAGAPAQIDVEIAVVPRQIVAEAMETAGRLGVVPTVAGLWQGTGLPPRFQLLFGLTSLAGDPPSFRRNRWLVRVVPAVLLAVAVGSHTVRHADREAQLVGRLDAAKEQARATEVIRKEVSALGERLAFLPARGRAPSALEVMNELSRELPDDTWVFSLEIANGEARIAGYAPAATALLGLLIRSPLMAGPRFRAPVTRAPDGKSDRFDLSVKLLQR